MSSLAQHYLHGLVFRHCEENYIVICTSAISGVCYYFMRLQQCSAPRNDCFGILPAHNDDLSI
ncbi:hypothetical protein [Rickettsia felis]|uniref:hypothetical protein n=1 Tax=Rickettsia felis TaxID=42862 RepID=UPI000B2E2986|nr:hypothetical protein [Rickettsia felis]